MYLSLGFMGGMVRKTFDISKMTTSEQWQGGFDPTLPSGENFGAPNISTWDASVGMSFNTSFGNEQKNTMFAGVAFHHLNRPKNSFYRNETIELNPKYVFSAGFKFKVNDFSEVTLQADHSVQGSSINTIAGGFYSYNLGDFADAPGLVIHGGTFLRWQDDLIPVLKVDKQPISVAISYDINVSTLKTASMGRGGFELSVVYTGFLNNDNSSLNKVLCPSF
jgi:type IX secretion system PorP/SprF family membrane protein